MIRIFLITLLLLGFARGQQVLLDSNQKISDQESVGIKIECLFSTLPSNGYAPIKVTITNDSQDDRRWTLKFKSGEDNYFRGKGVLYTNSQYQVSCPGGESHSTFLVVPVSTANDTLYSSQGESLEVEVLKGSRLIESGYINTKHSQDFPSILMSDDLFLMNGMRLNREVQSRHRCDFAGQYNPEELPEDWRCYHGYDVILISENTLPTISPGARTALKTWIRQGGTLVYCSEKTKIPKLFSDLENLGQGKMIHSPIGNGSRLDDRLVTQFARSSKTNIRQKVLNDDFGRSWDLANSFDKKSFGTTLVILILLAFAFLVGPVNLFVFAKAGQRHRLFITTPIISVITSLILGLLVVVQDGFGGKGVRLGLMEIGHGEDHNAYLTQEQISRTGLVFSSSFDVDEKVFMTTVPIARSNWSRYDTGGENDNLTVTINEKDQGHSFSGDWFQSRSEQAQFLSTVQPNRGKLTLSGSDNAPTLTSSFSFDIEDIVYRDSAGKLWKADRIPSSQTISLTAYSNGNYASYQRELSSQFSSSNKKKLRQLMERPRSFSAKSRNAPLIETHPSIDWKMSTTILTGTL